MAGSLRRGPGTGKRDGKQPRAQQELGSKLGIRYGVAMVIEGPNGNETLQENPTLGEVEAAIEKVE